jgi:hypothetical protein
MGNLFQEPSLALACDECIICNASATLRGRYNRKTRLSTRYNECNNDSAFLMREI